MVTRIDVNSQVPFTAASQHGRLPLELVDQIIHFVAGDVVSLRVCALTCHNWNSMARSHLFRRVNITTEKRLLAFEGLLRAAPLLDQYIRELSIGPFSPHMRQGGTARWAAQVPENLPRFLTYVRTIRFIRLSDAGEFCDAEFFALFYYFHSVTRLVLEDCAMNICVLQAFASSLPNLTDLVITNMLPLMITIWEAPPILTYPHLVVLVLDVAKIASPTMSNFLLWLFSTPSLHTLRSVDFGFTILDAKVVRRALLDVGSRLKHLGLHVKSMFETSEWEQEHIHREMNIGLCVNLVSLTIDLTTAQSAISLLKDVKAKDIHTVSFRMSDKQGKPLPDFESLSYIVTSGMFPQLSCVQFICEPDADARAVKDALTGALPDLYGRGMLRLLSSTLI